MKNFPSLRGRPPKGAGRSNLKTGIASGRREGGSPRNDIEILPSPFQVGYRMPAEWETHEATWLAWPQNKETWPGKVPAVEEIYLQMITALAPHEKVHLLVHDEFARDAVEKRLKARGVTKNVIYFLIPTVDTWIRDYGPCFIQNREGETACVNWIFNAWGGKYKDLMQDDRIPDLLEASLGMPMFRPGLVLEGGSIDTNGLGTCLTTEQCLLNPNRNLSPLTLPSPPEGERVRVRGKSEIEEALKNYLGLTHLIWLGEGIEGDDTDGHVDDITRFVGPSTVVTALEENTGDANHKPLQENLKRLRKAKDQEGKKLAIVTLPMPGRVECAFGRLPASYMNFYIANGVVLVPIFGHKNDSAALGILSEVFPKREIVGIRAEDLVLGLGGIHCVTHEQPAPHPNLLPMGERGE